MPPCLIQPAYPRLNPTRRCYSACYSDLLTPAIVIGISRPLTLAGVLVVKVEVKFPNGHKLWNPLSQAYDVDAHQDVRRLRSQTGIKMDVDRVIKGERLMRLRATSECAAMILALALPGGLWRIIP